MIYFLILNVYSLSAQGPLLTVGDAIREALKNRENIQSVKTDYLIAKAATSSAKKALIPQVSAGYSYRYNFISPSQIIPVGLFFPVPTDEKRAVQFGTDWQQSAGISLYMPFLDFFLVNRIKEAGINEKIKNVSLKAAEEELTAEVIKSYLSVHSKEMILKSAIEDTARTYNIKKLMTCRFNEGKVMKTDLNDAEISHRRAVDHYNSSFTNLLKEKLYLGFLTGISTEEILEYRFDFSFVGRPEIFSLHETSNTDSLYYLEQYRLQTELAGKQLMTEKGRLMPVVGLEAFAGGNQYTDRFEPFNTGRWYGSSYAGVTVRIPVAGGDLSGNRIRQLRLEEKSRELRYNDELRNVISRNLLMNIEIRQMEQKLNDEGHVLRLYGENLALYDSRFEKGQMSAGDLINYTFEYQSEKVKYESLKADLLIKKVEAVKNTGNLKALVSRLD